MKKTGPSINLCILVNSRDNILPNLTILSKEEAEQLSSEDLWLITEIEDELRKEATQFFDKMIGSRQGRKDFISWLWKFVC